MKRWDTIDVNMSPMRVYVAWRDGAREMPGVIVAQHGPGVDRFIDKHLVALSVEERIHVARTKIAGVTADFEIAPFLDSGQVFNDYKDVSFKNYRMTPGIGFRGVVKPNVVGRVDYGYSREGGAIFAGLDFPY